MKKGFKQTEVGVIPEDWEVISLIDLAERKKELFDDGDWIESEHITNEGIRLIQTGNIGEGKFIEKEDKKYIHPESFELLKCKELNKGDLLICRLAEPAGRSCVFPDIGENKVITSVDVTIFRPRPELVNRRYLNQIFTTNTWFNSVSENCGGTTHKRISRGALGKLSVPLPSLKEQTAIATALSDMDQLIAGLEQLIAKKKAIKLGAMQELLRPNPDSYREGWVVKKLGDLTKVFTKQTGFDYSAYIKPSLVQIKSDDTIPFIQNKDFNNKWINYNTDYFIPLSVALQFPKILLDEKCLLISISGSIGNIGVYESESLAFIGGAIAILKFQDEKIIDWIMYYLKSNDGQNKLFGSVKSGSHQNLILDDIRKVEVPIPSIEEQIRITNTLSDMDIEIGMLNENLEKHKLLKQGMMQELLTGKTRLV